MNETLDKIAPLVFKRKIGQEVGETTLTPPMLRVLALLDGTKNLGTISESLNISLSDLKEVLTQLHKMNLIQKVERSVKKLEKEYFIYMKTLLAASIGPVASVLISDTVKKMGERLDNFPVDRGMDLALKVSVKLFSEQEKQDFLKKMNSKLTSMS